MTTDQQIVDALKQILEAAKAIDSGVQSVCVLVSEDDTQPFLSIYNNRPHSYTPNGTGIETVLAKVKPYDPLTEKQAEIKRLQDEIANIEKQIAEKQANENNQ